MAAITTEIEWMQLLRSFTLNSIKGLSHEQLLTVPEKFNNHILWNVGHLLYSQCAFFYSLNQKPFPLPSGSEDQYKAWFDEGTSPKTWTTQPDVAEILDQFAGITKTIIDDIQAGAFDGFKTTELFPGVTLHNVPEIAGFQCIHEGMHMGAIGALKKFV